MPSNLKDSVRALVMDPAVAGLVAETEYRPLGGRSVAVAPPTYARASNDNDKTPQHAVSESAFIPARSGGGWFTEIAYDGERPRTGRRVLIDSVGSQSGRAETALWNAQGRIGFSLPGMVVTGAEATSVNDAELAAALAAEVTTWTGAHRQGDAWLRFAEDAEGPVWRQGGTVKELIANASAENAELLYGNFVNAAIYGFWLSSGVAARHRLPRAYSSEIIGYGAHPAVTGTTKLDPAGGASDKSKVSYRDGRLIVGKTGDKPSNFGFGQVPNQPYVTGYVCELILQQASVSLSVLRSLHFRDEDAKYAALTVMTLLAMLGHELAAEDGFLRSHCSLVATGQRWGIMRRGQEDPVEFDIGDTDELIDALREAIADAEAAGLSFAEQIRLTFSSAQQQLIVERIEAERAKQARER